MAHDSERIFVLLPKGISFTIFTSISILFLPAFSNDLLVKLISLAILCLPSDHILVMVRVEMENFAAAIFETLLYIHIF